MRAIARRTAGHLVSQRRPEGRGMGVRPVAAEEPAAPGVVTALPVGAVAGEPGCEAVWAVSNTGVQCG